MERPRHTHRALTAGLSAGAGLAVSVVMYAATIPFTQVHAVVEGAVVPFAIGSVVGVGILAAGSGIADARERGRQEDSAADASVKQRKEGLFGHGYDATPKGVPVIARATDALSEADAWADIDSLLDSSSPVSCDPARSKDIYEIALEEMARTSAGAAAPATTSAVSPDITATSAFVLSQVRASMASNAAGVSDETLPQRNAPAAVPAVNAGPAQVQATSAPAPETTNVLPVLTQDDPILTGAADEPDDEPVVEVPMADYSGHEGMWAEALAILAEKDEDVSAKAVEDNASRGAHFRKIGNTDPVNPLRMSAVAEGASATSLHTRVNEILEEELDRVPSQSMRNTSREYLRVIQGGTISMPRLSVEA